MSLIIKSRFYNKSSNVIIDYSEKNFTRQKKEIRESGTLYRKGNKLTFKLAGALNTTDNSNENTNYINDQRLVNLISIEKKDGGNFEIDCGNWPKDIIDLLDQDATYFLYKGSTIENFMKDKHIYHILSQGDIIKIGKIYLKVLHIRLNNQNKKFIKTSSSKGESDNINKSKNNSKEDNDDKNKEGQNTTEIKNNVLIEIEADNNPKTRNKKNKKRQSTTETHKLNAENLISNKKVNVSMIMSQKLNITPLEIDINNINEADIENIKQPIKVKKTRNKSRKNTKVSKKEVKNNKIKNIEQIKLQNKICRICLSGETNSSKNPLICPCICKGSMKFIHYLCLKNWLNLKIESELGSNNIETDRPTITYSADDIFCELCKSKFPDYVKHNGKLYNVTFYKPKYDQFLVLESVRNDNRRTRFIHIIPLNNFAMHRIGRLNNCDLSLPDSSISRVHCCFYIENNQLVLENNSKFGTKVLIQKQKLNMVQDYPLCIETQNTYLKLYIEKKFNLFTCCNSSTKSQIKIYPYQTQNQKGFDLFCSMVFKDDDDDYSDNENKKDKKEDENINLIENNNKEDDKKEIIKSESGSEDIKNNDKRSQEINKEENKDFTEKEEKNLIEIKLGEEKNLNEETKVKESEKNINIINENFQNKLSDKNEPKENLIDDDKIKEDKTEEREKAENLNLIHNEVNSNNKKKEFPLNCIKLNKIKNFDLISEKIKSNSKKEFSINEKKNDEISNKSMRNLISKIDKDSSKINNKETENPKEYLIQLESEQCVEKEKKSVINNLFKNNDIQTLKGYADDIDINKKQKESDKNNETESYKSNKSINLDKINNLSYKRLGERLDNKNNFSFAYNYDSIFGLIPNEKNESFLLFAPKHNKNIKFGNYNIHFESEKITDKKPAKKMWDIFNWELK